jgi:hypothetical protein
MSSKRERFALKEIDLCYELWLTAPTTTPLIEMLTNKLQITNQTHIEKSFSKLAILRNPINKDEVIIDEYLQQPNSSKPQNIIKLTENNPTLKDFLLCREQYYLTKSQVLTMIEDVFLNQESKSIQDLCTIIENECIEDEICYDVYKGFIEESIQNRISQDDHHQEPSSKRKRKSQGDKDNELNKVQESSRTNSSSASKQISSRQAFLRRILLPVLYFRDLERSYLHMIKDKILSVSVLVEAFDLVGNVKPTDNELKAMIDDVKHGKDFKDVFAFIEKYALS